MNSIKTCFSSSQSSHEDAYRYVPRTVCAFCGEEIELSPDELITHIREVGQNRYVCPLCRRLTAEAEDDGHTNREDLLPNDAGPLAWILLFLNECPKICMEDENNDSDEEESDSDEAAAACEGGGGMYPPEDAGSGTATCSDGDVSGQAEIILQASFRLIIRVRVTTP